MNLLEYTKRKLISFIREIDNLRSIEFPYSHSKDALEIIYKRLTTNVDDINNFTPEHDESIVKQKCSLILKDLSRYLPLLGFILRSTNVRNAFEVFGPLLRLSGDILEHENENKSNRKTKLIFSSEWNYSPHIYVGYHEFPHFVLIGLPAHESANPLLVPLAGHELGHLLWTKHKISDDYTQKIAQTILTILKEDNYWQRCANDLHLKIRDKDDLQNDMFAIKTWEPAYTWAMKQSEETFCDIIGLILFEQTYMHAFKYLLAPNVAGRRSFYYPTMLNRVRIIEETAKELGVEIEGQFTMLFQEDQERPNLTDSESFLIEVADEALACPRNEYQLEC